MQKSGGGEFIISRTSQVLARKPSRTKRVAEDLMRWVRWATLAADGLLQGLSVHKKEGGGLHHPHRPQDDLHHHHRPQDDRQQQQQQDCL